MGRIYTIPWTGAILAADTDMDLWEFTPVDDQPIRLRGFRLGQTTELGDAAEESLRITVKRLLATFSTGTGGITPVAEEPAKSAQAPGFTVEAQNETLATGGSTEILDELAWNVRNTPFEIWYPDERFCPSAKQPEGLVIRLEDTVDDDITFVGVAWVEEEA